MTSVGADLRVRGVVQGVGYRYFCRQRAAQFELVGWARNAPDGSVMLHVEGDRGSIELFIAELKTGPSNASVTALDVNWTSFSGQYQSFDITR